MADSRALIFNLLPAMFGSHIAEPEGEGAALQRPIMVYAAPVVEEEAVSPVVFLDAETVFEGIKVPRGEVVNGQIQS